jgi:hypothetical protein
MAEQALAVRFPPELRELLKETDGVKDEYNCDLVWSVERIVRDNLSIRENPEYRELFMPFDHLLFFADAGNGDQFAHAIHAGQIRTADVFVWNHEDDSRTWKAPDVYTYLKWWLDGTMSV